MAEIEKLTGHGAPSVLLPGSKGQIYEDLDTGRLYECKGERGFIKVDGDDQCDEFNWVLKGVDISYNDLQDKPEQGGSTGSGVFTVNFTKTGSNTTCDKTFEEIKNAYDSGLNVYAYLNQEHLGKCVLNLCVVVDTAYMFSANIFDDTIGMSYNLVIDSENNITSDGYKWNITPITAS